MGPSDGADLYLRTFPAGQLQLTANPTLCIGRNDVNPLATVLQLQACNVLTRGQQWTVEATGTDGSFVTGPITSAVDGKVMDVAAISSSIDADVNVAPFVHGPGQLFDFSAGLIRATQLGMCVGVCAYL